MSGGSTTTGLVWQYWCVTDVTSSASNVTVTRYPRPCVTAEAVWSCWNTTTDTTTTGDPWPTWCNNTAANAVSYYVPPGQYRAPPETAAQKAERERYQAEYCERLEREAVELKAATVKAQKLLLEHLSEEQREQWARLKSFIVRSLSGKQYRLREGTHGNVDLLGPDGKVLETWCVPAAPHQVGVPDHTVPLEDKLLTQKLWLEHDEEGICAKANKTRRVA
jgi:hypothetical protein